MGGRTGGGGAKTSHTVNMQYSGLKVDTWFNRCSWSKRGDLELLLSSWTTVIFDVYW